MRLEQFIVLEKLFQKWNIFAPGKQFIVKKNDSAVEIRRLLVRLEQLNVFENDPEMEYFCVPEIIHRVEKRFSSAICDARLGQFLYENDPQVVYFAWNLAKCGQTVYKRFTNA